ncbi:hypothetical protein OG216_19615 [Streptomycetaceae bacterium NBC_01309]
MNPTDSITGPVPGRDPSCAATMASYLQYGDWLMWDAVPPELMAKILACLAHEGWGSVRVSSRSITVRLDDRATGLSGAAVGDEHLYILWGATRPEWLWRTAHPGHPHRGCLAPLVAPADDPDQIAAQIIRVLRTGRSLP